MSEGPDSLSSKFQPHQLVDQLEAQWLKSEIPDIASYMRSSPLPDSAIWHDLIELDLEYRWKQYRSDASKTGRDSYGFPLFPKVEDYAELLDDSQRHLILTPELVAEEYRVRRTWGDRPNKRDYLARFPLDSVAVKSALNQIDTEFEIERATPLDEEDSSDLVDESTWLVRKQNKPESKPEDEVELLSSVGKYELKELLGRGGFGEVWKAYDPDLKRSVALKFPRRDVRFTSETLKYFRSEAQKMATLERVSGVIPVYEAGEADGQVYIVSYLVQGEDLGKIFKRGELLYEESARIVAEVAETLHRAHLKNLFHRDVKLSNILIGDNGDIFLSDFGLCVSEEEQLREGHSTTGTYAYMAPEQVQGFSHHIDGRADIYALGVVLYRLLTGRLPFIAETQAEYLEQVLHRAPRPPRQINDDIPAELERICLKCLNKDIKDRYTTAADLARELRSSVRQEVPSPVYGIRSKAVGLVSILALLLLLAIFWIPRIPGVKNPPEIGGQNLLSREPKELMFNHQHKFNNWNWDEQTESLYLRTVDDAMLSLGELDIKDKIISIRIESQPELTRFGFFWGGHAQNSLKYKERVFVARSVLVTTGETEVPNQIVVLTNWLIPDAGSKLRPVSKKAEQSISFGQPPQQTWTIQLVFEDVHLRQIFVNDQKYVLTDPAPRNGPDYQRGFVGIYAGRGDFVIKKLFWD